jgi:hypothetical protein
MSYDHKFEPGAYGVCRRCGTEHTAVDYRELLKRYMSVVECEEGTNFLNSPILSQEDYKILAALDKEMTEEAS